MTAPSSGTLEITRDGPLAIWTISNPEARNALSPAIYERGLAAAIAARTDPTLKAIVIQGADGLFCGGGNLNRLLGNRAQPKEVQYESIGHLMALMNALRACDQPIIAAVEGAAAGAGFSLALNCDLVVAARDARFVMSYAKVGLSPDGGGSYWLYQSLPATLAYELIAMAEPINAERLMQFGLVNRCVDKGEALAGARLLALTLANGATGALTAAKRLRRQATEAGLQAQMRLEQELFVENLHSDNGGEGISAFLQKRAPRFQ